MKVLTASDVLIEILIEEEPEPIEKALSFKSTGADHSEYIEKVQNDNGYNPWLWCFVEVRATYKGLSGSAYLGGCTYEDEEGFKAGGYYEQMVSEALEELNANIQNLVSELL